MTQAQEASYYLSKSHANLMTHERGTVGLNIDEGRARSQDWFGLLGRSPLNVAPAVEMCLSEAP